MRIRLHLKERVLIDIPQEKRLIVSDKPKLEFNQELVGTQKSTVKPKGLWYGIGDSWISFLQNEMPTYVEKFLYEIEIFPEKILLIDNEERFKLFYEKYKADKFGGTDDDIDWKMVSGDFSGIEINPYFWNFRLKYNWYYGWDVASGCIWKKDAIKSIKLLSDNWQERSTSDNSYDY